MKTPTKYLAIGTAVATMIAGGIVATSEAGPHPWGHGPGRGRGPGGPGNHLEHLARELGLTDAQKAQVQPILDAAAPQAKAIREEAHAKMKALMKDTLAKIQPLLTAEQLEDLRVHQRRMERFEAERKARESEAGKK
ncbi:MAG: Spy/CpxP family protein refolding chaperone [Verrucomicrobia bacterium]|nr:Spy/CpxP family protein refolding chaperone [Verrucomicrobiota bacterium]